MAHSPGSEDAAFLAESRAAMTRMMAAMQIQPSHEVDRDFVALMAPHHQGAIEMAKAELSYGQNTTLRRLAQEIIVTQQEEIAQMRLALVSATASPSTGLEAAAFLAKSHVAMTKMMVGMRITPFNDVDRDFVGMMIPHHQGAIDLAEAELRYGHNLALLGLAQDIIATQEQQIAVMRRALGEPLPPPQPLASTSRPLLPSQWTTQYAPSARGGLPCDTAASLAC